GGVADLLLIDGPGTPEGEHASAWARAVVRAGEVHAVAGLGIADAPLDREIVVGTVEGLGAAVVPHAVERPVFEDVGSIGQETVEVTGDPDVEEGPFRCGVGAGDAGPIEAIAGGGEPDAPVDAVDSCAARIGRGGVGA